MKSKSKELDVDFIGGQTPLTKEEEMAISQYIKSQKLLKAKEAQINILYEGDILELLNVE